MRTIELKEYEQSSPVRLSVQERDGLREHVSPLTIEPVVGETDLYTLRPGSTVGVVNLGSLVVSIQPKVRVDRLFFLLSYSLDPKHWRQPDVEFVQEPDIFEAVVFGFARLLQRALRRGLLQGYRSVEEDLATVRGRIRVEEQLRRRFGLPLPIAVRYDDFTDDIEENRLLRAAVARLGAMWIRSSESRRLLRHAESLLQRVSLVAYDPRQLPSIVYTRLNEHYCLPIEFAKLILRSTSIEVAETHPGRPTTASSAFLVNMNDVFESFVVVALREALNLSSSTLVHGSGGKALYLAEQRQIPLKPDLAWWEGGECSFVGDVKYKKPQVGQVLNADIYQVLAYAVALDLPGGTLIYAAGERPPASLRVRHIDKTIEVVSLDLDVPPAEILKRIKEIAQRIQDWRSVAVRPRQAIQPALLPRGA